MENQGLKFDLYCHSRQCDDIPDFPWGVNLSRVTVVYVGLCTGH